MMPSFQNSPLWPRHNLGSFLSVCQCNLIKTSVERHDGSHPICLSVLFPVQKLIHGSDNPTITATLHSNWPGMWRWESKQGLNFSLKPSFSIFYFCQFWWVEMIAALKCAPLSPYLNNTVSTTQSGPKWWTRRQTLPSVRPKNTEHTPKLQKFTVHIDLSKAAKTEVDQYMLNTTLH